MPQKHPLGVEKVTTLVPFVFESSPWEKLLRIELQLDPDCDINAILQASTVHVDIYTAKTKRLSAEY